MTKITIQRTFDPAKTYETEAGKQMKEFIDSQLSVNELVLRVLLNGISFTDNIYCAEKEVELKHGTPQVIQASKRVKGILVQRTLARMTEPLFWQYNDQGELSITAQFFAVPAVAVKVNLVLLFE